jgi:predicted PurR-regulated permease PerM
MNGSQPVTRPRWSPQVKLLVIVIGLVGLGFFFVRFNNAIPPVVLALILAYILNPLVTWLQQRLHIGRGWVVVIVFFLLLVIIAGIFMLVIPMLVRQLSLVSFDLVKIRDRIDAFAQAPMQVGGLTIDGHAVIAQANRSLQALFEPLLGQTLNIAATILEVFVWGMFILIVAVYLTRDSEKVMQWFGGLVPPDYRSDFQTLAAEINTIWSAFFRGQILLSFIVMCIITVVGWIIGLPFALLMGVLMGLLEFLPSVGHGIWLVLASGLALLAGSEWIPIPNWAFLLVVLGVHIIYTQFDLNYLIPRIIGRSVHLPPLVIILGIVAGASIAGVLGVVLAAPTIASLRVVGRYVYARLLDQDPGIPEHITEELPPPNLRWWRNRSTRARIQKKEPRGS